MGKYGMVGMGMGKVWVWGAADIFRFNLPFGTPPSLRGPSVHAAELQRVDL